MTLNTRLVSRQISEPHASRKLQQHVDRSVDLFYSVVKLGYAGPGRLPEPQAPPKKKELKSTKSTPTKLTVLETQEMLPAHEANSTCRISLIRWRTLP